MVSNKALLLLIGLALATVLLITSEVAARDLAETATEKKTGADAGTETNGVEDAKYGGGYGGYPGGGNGGYHGGGYRGGGYCRYGCCRRDYYGGCRRCCSYAGEAVDAETEAKPHN